MRMKNCKLLTFAMLAVSFLLAGTPATAAPGSRGDLSAADALQQQSLTVAGTVVDVTGEPIIGADIMFKGTTVGTSSDLDGRFSLTIPGPGTLVVSYVGFRTVEIPVAASDRNLSILLQTDAEQLDDLVFIGYGSVKKSDLTGSVASVKSDDMLKRNPIDVGQGLQGLAAGVQILRNSGDPRGGTTIRIRGVATVNGSADPLYVVDGVQVGRSIDFLNPSDIESIEVLKDASATAIYGSRGANGVIMITTKRGQQGSNQLDFTANWGLNTSPSRLEVGTIQEFVKAIRTTKQNDGTAFTEMAWADPSLDSRLNNIDWQDVMTRKALSQNYNVSVSGGTRNTQGRISLGYLNNQGIVVNSGFERFTSRLNVQHTIKDFIRMGASMAFVHGIYAGGGNAYSFASQIPSMDDLDENGQLVNVPIQWPDGTWGHYKKEGAGDIEKGVDNIYAAAMVRDSRNRYNQVMTNANLDIDLFKGLTLHNVFGYNFNNSEYDAYTPENHRTFVSDTNPDSYSLSFNNSSTVSLETYLTYDLTLGSHRLNLMGGYSVSRQTSQDLNGSAESMPANTVRRIDLTTNPSSKNVGGGLGTPVRFVSWYGRVNYNILERYLFTATVRRDGSSNFGVGNRWGVFPSASFAWRISEEPFMKEQDFFSSMKLRLGWGQTGNAGGATSLSVEQLTSRYMMYYWYLNGSPVNAPGIAKSSEVDTNLKWETNEQANIGLDFGILKGQLSFSLDYFIRTAKDLLLYKTIRPSTGYDNVYTNSGTIRNQGFEFQVTYATRINQDWGVNASLTGSTLKNVAVDVGDDIFHSGGVDAGYYWDNYSLTRNGYPVGSFYGWRVDGIFQDQSEIDRLNAEAASKSGGEVAYYQALNTAPGDYKFKDLNGDGYINDDDREIIGNGYPKLNFGLNLGVNYKAFDFSMNLYGVLGQDILSYSYARLNTIYNPRNGYQNCLSDFLNNAWTPQNKSTVYTRLTGKDDNHNVRVSDAFIKKGDFLKIGNVQLGYTLPKPVVNAMRMRSARVYVSVDNPLTISAYNKYGNPEIGNSNVLRTGFDSGRYPFPTTYNFGMSVQF